LNQKSIVEETLVKLNGKICKKKINITENEKKIVLLTKLFKNNNPNDIFTKIMT
jgi:uncharacterized coiled-coil protein SlyX